MDCGLELVKQGAEARLYHGLFQGRSCIVKERFSKKYRHPDLDRELTKERMRNEARSLVRCRMAGVHAPVVYSVNLKRNWIVMEHMVNRVTVKDFIKKPASRPDLEVLAANIGRDVGNLHTQNVIHGDLTTSNMLVEEATLQLTFIDFGLSYVDSTPEDKGVDLYVLERALLSTHPDTEWFFQGVLDSYTTTKDSKEVIKKLEEVRLRGRKRLMIG